MRRDTQAFADFGDARDQHHFAIGEIAGDQRMFAVPSRYRDGARFQPAMAAEVRTRNLAGWKEALRRTLG